MVVYKLINNKDYWNTQIKRAENFSPYQIFEWGEYKRNIGWNVIRIEANNNGSMAYLQITYKLKLSMFLGWCIGSISGSIENFNAKELIVFIQKTFAVKQVLIKSSFTNELRFNESLSLYTSNWKKTTKKINSDYTIIVNLQKEIDILISECSSNWRKNFNRGISKNSAITINYLKDLDINSIDCVFQRFKTIKDLPLPSLEELNLIQKNLGQNIMVATSISGDQIIGLRAFLFFDNKALDFWAVTDEVGRKNYTSFVLLFELFKKAQEMNILEYDMSGIDPLVNPNVFGFKNGLRAKVIEKLGEWEISNSKLLTYFINKVYLK